MLLNVEYCYATNNGFVGLYKKAKCLLVIAHPVIHLLNAAGDRYLVVHNNILKNMSSYMMTSC